MLGRINLLLLPYAGGSAGVFREWKSRLPAWVHPVPLTLPGRGARHGEALHYEWPALMDVLTWEVRPYVDRPVAIFGHSLGALVALEMAHALRIRLGKEPAWLGVAGCIAPSRRQAERKWLSCPEDEFLEELRSLNGTPPELLENRELLDLVMPALRADFHLAGIYEYRQRPPLATPMLIMGGTQDEEVMDVPDNLSAWGDETRGASRIKKIEAGHFFIESHRDEVIRSIIPDLDAVRADAERAHA